MDVTQRNFIRLLKCATFGGKERVEPMSPWKWQRLYKMSLLHGVAGLVYDGIARCHDDFFLQIPDELMTTWRRTIASIENANAKNDIEVAELFATFTHNKLRPILIKGQGIATLYPTPQHRTGGDIDVYFPYTSHWERANEWATEHGEDIDRSEKLTTSYVYDGTSVEHHARLAMLTNKIFNHQLQAIIDKEIKCCDSAYAIVNGYKVEVPPPTLNMLVVLIRIVRYILNDGLSLKQLVDLGMLLRKEGDKVDFVKLQQWIDKLCIGSMVQLVGAVLMGIFDFTIEELPFMQEKRNINISTIMNDIFRMKGNHSEEWYFTQGKNIFVRTSNSTAMMWHLRRTFRYFGYYPAETATNAVYSFVHSISHIEE